MRFRAWDGWGGGSDPELRFLNVCVCVWSAKVRRAIDLKACSGCMQGFRLQGLRPRERIIGIWVEGFDLGVRGLSRTHTDLPIRAWLPAWRGLGVVRG